MSEEKKPFAFSFTKKKEKSKVIQTKFGSINNQNNEKKELITSLENNKIKKSKTESNGTKISAADEDMEAIDALIQDSNSFATKRKNQDDNDNDTIVDIEAFGIYFFKYI